MSVWILLWLYFFPLLFHFYCYLCGFCCCFALYICSISEVPNVKIYRKLYSEKYMSSLCSLLPHVGKQSPQFLVYLSCVSICKDKHNFYILFFPFFVKKMLTYILLSFSLCLSLSLLVSQIYNLLSPLNTLLYRLATFEFTEIFFNLYYIYKAFH